MVGAFGFLGALACFGAAAGVTAKENARIARDAREMASRRVSYSPSKEVKEVYDWLNRYKGMFTLNSRGNTVRKVIDKANIGLYEYGCSVLLMEELLDRGIPYDPNYVNELTGMNRSNLIRRTNYRPYAFSLSEEEKAKLKLYPIK